MRRLPWLDNVPVIPLAGLRAQFVVSARVRGRVVTRLGTFDAPAVSLVGR